MPRTRAAKATPLFRLLAASAVALPLLTACAAGQQAATNQVTSSIDGTNANVGDVGVRFAHIDVADTESATGTVYVSFFNSGSEADELVSVTSTAGQVTLSGAGPLTLPSLGRVDLLDSSPAGSATISITGNENLRRGTVVPLTFQFARAGSLEISVPVQVPEERPELDEEYKGVFDHEGE